MIDKLEGSVVQLLADDLRVRALQLALEDTEVKSFIDHVESRIRELQGESARCYLQFDEGQHRQKLTAAFVPLHIVKSSFGSKAATTMLTKMLASDKSKKDLGFDDLQGQHDDVNADVIETLKQGHVVLRGEAGTGKTSVCKHIVDQWVQNRLDLFDFVFFIPMKDIRTKVPADVRDPFEILFQGYLKDVLAGSLETRFRIGETNIERNFCLAFWNYIFSNKKGLFIFEGYDEAFSHEPSQCLISLLLEKSPPNMKVLISTRPHVTLPQVRGSNDNVTLDTRGFSPDGIQNYINMYFSIFPDSLGLKTSLESYLTQHPKIRKICGIPINLEIICGIWRSGLDQTFLSQDLLVSNLYDNMINKLLVRFLQRDEASDIHQYKSMSEKYQFVGSDARCQSLLGLLGKLAAIAVDKDTYIITVDFRSIRGATSDAEMAYYKNVAPHTIITELQQCGFLKPVGDEGKFEYEFPHVSFFEFIYARRIANAIVQSSNNIGNNDKMLMKNKRYDPRFKLTWIFIAGNIRILQSNRQDATVQNLKVFFKLLLHDDASRDLFGVYETELLVRCCEEANWAVGDITNSLLRYLGEWTVGIGKLKDRRSMFLKELVSLYGDCPTAFSKAIYKGREGVLNFIAYEARDRQYRVLVFGAVFVSVCILLTIPVILVAGIILLIIGLLIIGIMYPCGGANLLGMVPTESSKEVTTNLSRDGDASFPLQIQGGETNAASASTSAAPTTPNAASMNRDTAAKAEPAMPPPISECQLCGLVCCCPCWCGSFVPLGLAAAGVALAASCVVLGVACASTTTYVVSCAGYPLYVFFNQRSREQGYQESATELLSQLQLQEKQQILPLQRVLETGNAGDICRVLRVIRFLDVDPSLKVRMRNMMRSVLCNAKFRHNGRLQLCAFDVLVANIDERVPASSILAQDESLLFFNRGFYYMVFGQYLELDGAEHAQFVLAGFSKIFPSEIVNLVRKVVVHFRDCRISCCGVRRFLDVGQKAFVDFLIAKRCMKCDAQEAIFLPDHTCLFLFMQYSSLRGYLLPILLWQTKLCRLDRIEAVYSEIAQQWLLSDVNLTPPVAVVLRPSFDMHHNMYSRKENITSETDTGPTEDTITTVSPLRTSLLESDQFHENTNATAEVQEDEGTRGSTVILTRCQVFERMLRSLNQHSGYFDYDLPEMLEVLRVFPTSLDQSVTNDEQKQQEQKLREKLVIKLLSIAQYLSLLRDFQLLVLPMLVVYVIPFLILSWWYRDFTNPLMPGYCLLYAAVVAECLYFFFAPSWNIFGVLESFLDTFEAGVNNVDDNIRPNSQQESVDAVELYAQQTKEASKNCLRAIGGTTGTFVAYTRIFAGVIFSVVASIWVYAKEMALMYILSALDCAFCLIVCTTCVMCCFPSVKMSPFLTGYMKFAASWYMKFAYRVLIIDQIHLLFGRDDFFVHLLENYPWFCPFNSTDGLRTLLRAMLSSQFAALYQYDAKKNSFCWSRYNQLTVFTCKCPYALKRDLRKARLLPKRPLDDVRLLQNNAAAAYRPQQPAEAYAHYDDIDTNNDGNANAAENANGDDIIWTQDDTKSVRMYWEGQLTSLENEAALLLNRCTGPAPVPNGRVV